VVFAFYQWSADPLTDAKRSLCLQPAGTIHQGGSDRQLWRLIAGVVLGTVSDAGGRNRRQSLPGQQDAQAVAGQNDRRSPIARAMAWASQITTIALEMVVPAVGGLWLDHKLGTELVFLVLGVAIGATGGIMHLLQMARRWQAEQNREDRQADLGNSDPTGGDPAARPD